MPMNGSQMPTNKFQASDNNREKERKVFVEERHRAIVAMLTEQGSATVKELREQLGVSPETIRRDLSVLDQQSRLIKTHGGAVRIDEDKPGITERQRANAEAKKAIAARAASFVFDGATVILDCGSTTQCVADALSDKQGLTVITNDLTICGKLARRNGNTVHLLGGEILDEEDATEGPDTTAMLSHYVADIAIIGCGGISSGPWLMAYTRAGRELRRMMLEAAKISIAVADSTKFDLSPPVRVDNFESVTYLVTDVHVPAGRLIEFADLPVELLIVE